VNNSRTRKLILRFILNSPKLEFWSTKYRAKISNALKHAWGERMYGILHTILDKDGRKWTKKDKDIVQDNIIRYAFPQRKPNKQEETYLLDIIRFLLHIENTNMSGKYIKSYIQAKENIQKGNLLTRQTLEGIRSIYHPDIPKEKVLEITSKVASSGEKMRMQKKSKEAKEKGFSVDTEFDPNAIDSVKLYIYGYEMGFTEEIKETLDKKAKKAADQVSMSFSKLGIIVDCSRSQFGNMEQKLRPMAITLATRDMLKHLSEKEAEIVYISGKGSEFNPTPYGETSIAKSLVEVLKKNVDSVFILTDGYENSPAGMTNKVVKSLRNMGDDTPIYQITPTMSADSQGVRKLSDYISTMSISKPEGIALSIMKSAFEIDVEKAVAGLKNMTLAKLPA
jgi:hypothetical protein